MAGEIKSYEWGDWYFTTVGIMGRMASEIKRSNWGIGKILLWEEWGIAV